VLSPQNDAPHVQNTTIYTSKKTPLAAYEFFFSSMSGCSIHGPGHCRARGPQLGFPAEVFAVTWLLRPKTKGYQEILETLLQSK